MRVQVHTFGCRSNHADSVSLEATLLARGFDLGGEDADVHLVNTCCVTDTADREAFQLIGKIHREHPTTQIVVTGCLAESGRERLAALDGVTAVFPPGEREKILSAISGGVVSDVHVHGRKRRREFSEADLVRADVPAPGARLGDHRARARYHLRVQEGCENHCTFCIIPETRGKLSSRRADDILADLCSLSAAGYNEVVLTGTHLGGWGEDIGESLLGLLRRIALESPISRIRLSSLDPNDVPLECIDLIAQSPVFCPHLHLCFQSLSDRTLKRMNRRYRSEEALDLARYALTRIPGLSLGTDIIAGFPGETREEFDETLSRLEDLPISYLHAFPYSERSGTGATRLDGPLEVVERKRRAARLRALSGRKEADFARSLIRSQVEFIVEAERRSPEGTRRACGVLQGTTRQFVTAQVCGQADVGELIWAKAVSYDEKDGVLICE